MDALPGSRPSTLDPFADVLKADPTRVVVLSSMIRVIRTWSVPLISIVIVVTALAVIGRAIHTTWHARRVAVVEFRCRDAMQRKDWPALDQSARQWLVLDPNSGLGWLYLGESAQRQGDLGLTAKCLWSVPNEDPRCVPALLELLELQLAKFKRPLDAVTTCERILQLEPGEATAHQRLVYIYALSLQRRRMIEQIRRAAQYNCLKPEMIVYLLNSGSLRFSNGVSVNTEWLASHPESEVFEVARAVQLVQISHSAGSEFLAESGLSPGDSSLIDACRKKHPTNLEVLAYFLEKGTATGDFDEVAGILATVPAEAESDSRFWRAKGWLHQARNELALAEEAYIRGLRIDPYDWRARHQFAGVLRQQGKASQVERETQLVLQGKQLERQLFELPTAGSIPIHLHASILQYCEEIGDTETLPLIRKTFQGDATALPPPAPPDPVRQGATSTGQKP